MFRQVETDPSLPCNTTVYRIVDFFSAADIISNKRFMFSRADTFQDANEGIDRLLAQLESAGLVKGCLGMGWNNEDSAMKSHNQLQCSHYISCWSQTRDSVAMWSLYSKDLCSIQISTKTSKLQTIAENFIEKYSFMRLKESDSGKSIVICANARIAPVTYQSLTYLLKKVSRRFKAYSRLGTRYQKEGKDFPSRPGKIPALFFEREKHRRIFTSGDACLLKDISFDHEKEIRIVIRLGEETCHEQTLKLKEFIDPSHPYHILIKGDLNLFGNIKTANVPKKEFISCPDDFIEAVTIDPRCPAHKEAFMRNWFEGHGIQVIKSDCFGYLPKMFHVYPSW